MAQVARPLVQDDRLAQRIGKELSHIAKDSARQMVEIKSTARYVTIFLNSQLAGNRNSTIAASSNKTLSQWEAVHTACGDAFNGLRNTVVDGISVIDDLQNFLKYLAISEESVETKLSQIRRQREFLNVKVENAKAVVRDLRNVLDCIKKFQNHWPRDTTEYSKEVAPRVKEITDKINRLLQRPIVNQANVAEGCNASGLAKALILLLPPNTALDFRRLMKVDDGARLEEIRDIQITGTDARAISVLDNLTNVGRLLGEDMKSVGDSFQYGRGEESNRLQTTIVLYECLLNSLKDVRNILNSTSTSAGGAGRASDQKGGGNFFSRIWRKITGRR